MNKPSLFIALALSLPASLAAAKPPEKPPIPEEVKQACASVGQGEPCSFTMRGRTMQGTCEQLGNLGLVCRPRRAPAQKK